MNVWAQQGDTVDDICHRHYGRTEQVVELVYAANPGLAESGPVLPHGCEVTLPDLPDSSAVGETVNLWS
ncbi:tail protein X [Pantoea agglomerans]|uniref:Tail protein X n=1 Tax=Enterobacter agglomerans TaxID=549 RepID=A0ACC5RK91_ENTAG|nr:tail protein X [Pantoea agglomerans]MBK4725034.1 tail protein X [Pantoea agglomerans]